MLVSSQPLPHSLKSRAVSGGMGKIMHFACCSTPVQHGHRGVTGFCGAAVGRCGVAMIFVIAVGSQRPLRCRKDLHDQPRGHGEEHRVTARSHLVHGVRVNTTNSEL